MAKTSSASIGVTVSGDGETATYVPPGSPMANAAAPRGGTEDKVLALGANVVTIPAGAIGVVIVPPTSSSNAKTIMGQFGDLGIPIRPNSPMLLTFAAAPVSFTIVAAAAETINLHWL